MDLSIYSQGVGAGEIDQYRHPFNYELVGKTFVFAMDDGYDYCLSVLDKNNLEWCISNGEKSLASYQCLKGDETTYLLTFQLSGCTPRINHTLVIDLENNLVTRIISKIGLNPQYPYLIKTEFEFGAIREEGKELPFKRHGFTSDMIGNAIHWTYGGAMSMIHIYYSANYYRITAAPDIEPPNELKEKTNELHSPMKDLPSTDEPANYVKIKDGMYLFSLVEENMEKLLGDRMPYRSMTMCFLQNYKRVYQVGRSFGTITMDGVDSETNTMFSAYGKIAKIDKSFFTDPNPYLV